MPNAGGPRRGKRLHLLALLSLLSSLFLTVVVHGVQPAPLPDTATVYNGLLYAEMAPIVSVLEKQGIRVKLLWHDAQRSDTSCPKYLLGHSMGGNAALRQAVKCQAAGHPPALVVTIDPGRAPLFSSCPKKIRCVNYYNPAHPIGGQYVYGADNHIIEGYEHLYMPLAAEKQVEALVKP